MIEVLKHPTYARLFSAQVIALLGTGLLTVALGLLAFDLAGDRAASSCAASLTRAVLRVSEQDLACIRFGQHPRLPCFNVRTRGRVETAARRGRLQLHALHLSSI